jgi:hypothetical protein
MPEKAAQLCPLAFGRNVSGWELSSQGCTAWAENPSRLSPPYLLHRAPESQIHLFIAFNIFSVLLFPFFLSAQHPISRNSSERGTYKSGLRSSFEELLLGKSSVSHCNF